MTKKPESASSLVGRQGKADLLWPRGWMVLCWLCCSCPHHRCGWQEVERTHPRLCATKHSTPETDMEIVNKYLHVPINNGLDWDQTGQNGHWAHPSGLCGISYGRVCWASASLVRRWEGARSVLGYPPGHSREGGTQVLSRLFQPLQDTSKHWAAPSVCEGTVPQVFCAPPWVALLVSGIVFLIFHSQVCEYLQESLTVCLSVSQRVQSKAI